MTLKPMESVCFAPWQVMLIFLDAYFVYFKKKNAHRQVSVGFKSAQYHPNMNTTIWACVENSI